MLKFFLLGIMGVVVVGCDSFSDSEIIVKANPEKRKPKHDYMPPEEKPVENNLPENPLFPVTPQVGLRIPLGK